MDASDYFVLTFIGAMAFMAGWLMGNSQGLLEGAQIVMEAQANGMPLAGM